VQTKLNARENFHRSAILNTAATWGETVVRAIVGFLLNPFTNSILGQQMFGVWQVLGQLNSFMVVGDMRVATTLKWLIAKDRSVKSDRELRIMFSASFFANIILMPIQILAGLFLVWVSPIVSKAEAHEYSSVRIASCLLVGSFVFTQFFFIYDQVLAGMNLAYKTTWVRLIMIFLGSTLSFVVLKFGWGMVGLSIVSLLVSIIGGLLVGWVASKSVNWIGLIPVPKSDILRFIRLTGWFMVGKLIETANASVDVLMLSYFAGPKSVTKYVFCKYIIQLVGIFISGFTNATIVGLGKLLGEKNILQIIAARQKLVLMVTWSVAIAGANICVLNRSFVKIWTGQDYLVGQTEVVLMVLIMFVKIIQDVDGALILLSDDAKCICVTGLKAITVTLSIGCFMIPKYDQFGLLLSLLSGSIFGLIKFKKRLSIIFGKFEINFLKFLLSRNAFVPMFLLIVSAFIGSIVKVNHWFGFVICVPLITLLSVGVALVLCCSNAERRSLLGYCNNTLRKVMR
jgi:O-antigen/teichoic acid export membrane protein